MLKLMKTTLGRILHSGSSSLRMSRITRMSICGAKVHASCRKKPIEAVTIW